MLNTRIHFFRSLSCCFNNLRLSLLMATLISFGCSTHDNVDIYNKMTAKQIYDRATLAYQNHHEQDAIDDYRGLISHYPYGPYAEAGYLGLMASEYQHRDSEAGVATVDQFLKLYPNHPHADYALYLKGMLYFQEQHGVLFRYLNVKLSRRDTIPWQEAYLAFQQLQMSYPHSQYAADARQHMIYIKNQLAEHELLIADFYYQRHAYLAAFNRASDILLHYPNTPAEQEALLCLYESANQLKLQDVADQAHQLLMLNQLT